MNDIRRTILLVLFSGSLMLLWDAWNKHQGQASLFAPTPVQQSTGPAKSSAASASLSSTGMPPLTAATPASAAAVPVAVPSQTFVVSTDVLRATLDTQGGAVVKLELIAHAVANLKPGMDPKQAENFEPVVLFDRSSEHYYVAQTGIAVGGVHLPPVVMSVQPGVRVMEAGQNQVVVQFEATTPEGLRWLKTYTFKRASYEIAVKQQFINGSGVALIPQLYLQLVRDDTPLPDASGYYKTFMGPAIYTPMSKYKKIEFKKLDSNEAEYDKWADSGWVAMVQHYFASAWLVPLEQKREFFVRKIEDHRYAVGMQFNPGQMAPGQSKEFDAILYAGPQYEKVLQQIAPGFELVKDYGYFKVLAEPLFWLLDKLHGFLQNWGWSIVALVLLLKIAFYGLNASAYRSMAKMKALNPRIMEMRARLKDKPQQMQQEMMKIYREEKVNPVGGCLPIVIQIPVFIALYWVLLSSVEMRHAPWLGWIHDLSAKDPLFILPVLMTASSLVQTWLNPTPPDPVQAKMMWIMPLAFSFMFFYFPAGLVLYWLTNNILSITQQWLINKQLGVKN